MDTSTPPQRLTDRKRAAIVDAAIEEFLAAGYDATSMDRIAARADVSKRTVYNHFPGKETLFAAILNKLWEATRTGSSPTYRADVPLREQLLALLDRKLRLMNDEAFLALARVAIGAAIHSPERARDMVERLSEREEDLTVWVRAAAAAGRLSVTDPVFAVDGAGAAESCGIGCRHVPRVLRATGRRRRTASPARLNAPPEASRSTDSSKPLRCARGVDERANRPIPGSTNAKWRPPVSIGHLA